MVSYKVPEIEVNAITEQTNLAIDCYKIIANRPKTSCNGAEAFMVGIQTSDRSHFAHNRAMC